ncbi:hypothetical protein [Sphaerimonospora mesophila]|uniref:hypothetical protein n=1 Tax=Sphaerimonospora mesophila TaxID=37483 RepID=UPI0006E3471C
MYAGSLLRYTIKAVDWRPLALAAVLLAGLGLSLDPFSGHPLPVRGWVEALRISGVLLGAAAGFVLIDPLDDELGALPTPRWVRQAVRIGLAVSTSCLIWLAFYAITSWNVAPGHDGYQGGVQLEAITCVVLGLAYAGTALRYRAGTVAGLTGASALLATLIVSLFLREEAREYSPWVRPEQESWDLVHRWWIVALVAALAWLIAMSRQIRS